MREIGKNYRAWDIKPISPNVASRDFNLAAENLVAHAILAASTHNTQPWEYEVTEEKRRVDVRLRSDLVLSQSDVNKREAYITMGCTLLNMEFWLQRYFGDTYGVEI